MAVPESSRLYSKSGNQAVIVLQFFFFFNTVLTIVGLLLFHMDFRKNISIFTRSLVEFLYGLHCICTIIWEKLILNYWVLRSMKTLNLSLEAVLRRMWLRVGPRAGPWQSEAPHPLPVLGMYPLPTIPTAGAIFKDTRRPLSPWRQWRPRTPFSRRE